LEPSWRARQFAELFSTHTIPTVASSSLVRQLGLAEHELCPCATAPGDTRTPETQFTCTTGRDLGARALAPIVSGNFAEPGTGFAKMVNASFQVGMQQTKMPTPLSTNARHSAWRWIPWNASAPRCRRLAWRMGSDHIARRNTQGSAYAPICLTQNAVVARIPNSGRTRIIQHRRKNR